MLGWGSISLPQLIILQHFILKLQDYLLGLYIIVGLTDLNKHLTIVSKNGLSSLGLMPSQSPMRAAAACAWTLEVRQK